MEPNTEGTVEFSRQGFDNASIIMEIQKAFEAGHDYNIADLTGGQAGRVQSLETTFKKITFEEEAASFWRALPKEKVTSTVLEYARINEVAGTVFYEEGGDVDNQSDSMDRKFDLVKYIGVKGMVTFQAKTVKMLEDAEVLETQNKTRSMVRGLDLACWFGDSTINPLEWDGLITNVLANSPYPTQNIIDKRGKRLSDNDVNDATTIIKGAYGFGPLKLWLSLDGANNYVKDKIASKMYVTNAAGDINPTGQEFKKFMVSNGSGVVETDVFLRAQTAMTNRILNAGKTALAKAHSSAPDEPTAVLTSEAITEPTPDSLYSLDNGDYDYAVVPFNAYGEGLGYECTVTHSGGSKISKFVITKAGTGNAPLGYKIYRRAGASTDVKDYQYVLTVKQGATTTTVYDTGEWIPGCTWGAMIEWNNQTLRFAQLADLMKLPYGYRRDAKEWLQKLYGVLQVYNPGRVVLFKNLGTLANS